MLAKLFCLLVLTHLCLSVPVKVQVDILEIAKASGGAVDVSNKQVAKEVIVNSYTGNCERDCGPATTDTKETNSASQFKIHLDPKP